MRRGPEAHNNSVYYSDDSRETSFYSINNPTERSSLREECPEQNQIVRVGFILNQDQEEISAISIIESQKDTQRSLLAALQGSDHKELNKTKNKTPKTPLQLQDHPPTEEGSEQIIHEQFSFHISPRHEIIQQGNGVNRGNGILHDRQIETPKLSAPVCVEVDKKEQHLENRSASDGLSKELALNGSQQKFRFPPANLADNSAKIDTQGFRKGIISEIEDLKQTYKKLFEGLDNQTGDKPAETNDLAANSLAAQEKREEKVTVKACAEAACEETNTNSHKLKSEIGELKAIDSIAKVYQNDEEFMKTSKHSSDRNAGSGKLVQEIKGLLNSFREEINDHSNGISKTQQEASIYHSFEIFSFRNGVLTESCRENTSNSNRDQHQIDEKINQITGESTDRYNKVRFENRITEGKENVCVQGVLPCGHNQKLNEIAAQRKNLNDAPQKIDAGDKFKNIKSRNDEIHKLLNIPKLKMNEEKGLSGLNGATEMLQKIQGTLLINKELYSCTQRKEDETAVIHAESNRAVHKEERIPTESENFEEYFDEIFNIIQGPSKNKENFAAVFFGADGRKHNPELSNPFMKSDSNRGREEEVVLKQSSQSFQPQSQKMFSTAAQLSRFQANAVNASSALSQQQQQPNEGGNYQSFNQEQPRKSSQDNRPKDLRDSLEGTKDFIKETTSVQWKPPAENITNGRKSSVSLLAESKSKEHLSVNANHPILDIYKKNDAVREDTTSDAPNETLGNDSIQTKVMKIIQGQDSKTSNSERSENLKNDLKRNNFETQNSLNPPEIQETEEIALLTDYGEKVTDSSARFKNECYTTLFEETQKRATAPLNKPSSELFQTAPMRGERQKRPSLDRISFEQRFAQKIQNQDARRVSQPAPLSNELTSYYPTFQPASSSDEASNGVQITNPQVFDSDASERLKSHETPQKSLPKPHEQFPYEEGRLGYLRIESYLKSPPNTAAKPFSNNSRNPSDSIIELKNIYPSDNSSAPSSLDDPKPFILRNAPQLVTSPVQQNKWNSFGPIEQNKVKSQLSRLIGNTTVKDNTTTKASKADSKGWSTSWREDNSGHGKSSLSKSRQQEVSPDKEIKDAFPKMYDKRKKAQMSQATSFEERMKTDIQFRNNQLQALNMLLEEVKPQGCAKSRASSYGRLAKPGNLPKSEENCFERLSRDSRRRNAMARERENLKNEIESMLEDKLYTSPPKKVQHDVNKIVSRLWEDANNRKMVKDKLASINVAEDILKAYDTATGHVNLGVLCSDSNTNSKVQTLINTGKSGSRGTSANASRKISAATEKTVAHHQMNVEATCGDLKYLQQAREALLLQHLKVKSNIEEMYKRSKQNSCVASQLSTKINTPVQTHRSPKASVVNIVHESAMSPSKQHSTLQNPMFQTPVQRSNSSYQRKESVPISFAMNVSNTGSEYWREDRK